MGNICIIPARGGSKRIPRKNIKEFLGKPIISYSIKTALDSGLFDEVIVSTNDLEIADLAKKFGANVPFMRSEKNSKQNSRKTKQRIVPNQRKVLQLRKPNQRKALKLPRLRQNPNQRNLLLVDCSGRKHQPRSTKENQAVKQIGSWKMHLIQFTIRMELVRS